MNAASEHQRIAATHLRSMMGYAISRGVSEQSMLDLISYSVDQDRNDEATIKANEFYSVISIIDEQLQDDVWGIRAGYYLNMKVLGLIYHISIEVNLQERVRMTMNKNLTGVRILSGL